MYTWCTREEFRDDYFDLDWCESERGTFSTYESARTNAVKNGYDNADVMVIRIG